MLVKEIVTRDYVTKSNLPASDYVINPYVGCPHGCKYCYASFMKRFTGHTEEWGTFVDVKRCEKKIDVKKLAGKRVFLSSVTDCYNPLEKDCKITRGILKELLEAKCSLSISTKSSLILRDLDLLKRFEDLTVSVSINTLDEMFRRDMDKASSIEERIRTLKVLHENGIYTILFMSPIFPYITDWRAIVDETRNFVDEFWFENLNLRGSYKGTILEYVKEKYPKYYDFYRNIYYKKDTTYWRDLSHSIEEYCSKEGIVYKNYFYHEKLVKDKTKQKA